MLLTSHAISIDIQALRRTRRCQSDPAAGLRGGAILCLSCYTDSISAIEDDAECCEIPGISPGAAPAMQMICRV